MVKCSSHFQVLFPAQQEFLLEGVDAAEISRIQSVMVSDSSSSSAYVYECEKLRIICDFPFSMEQSDQSSTYRECLAIYNIFTTNFEFLKLNSNLSVVWLTDNQCLPSIIARGSRVKILQDLAIAIKEQELKFNIRLHIVWQRRSTKLLQIADSGSKNTNTDEWQIDNNDFKTICDKFEVTPVIDMMATATNTKCEKFISKLPDRQAIAVNIFFYKLVPNIVYYCLPPVKLIIPILHKILEVPNISVLFIVPLWKSASFWPQFLNKNKFQSFVKKIFVFQTNFSAESHDCLFQGRKNFSMLATLIVTS